MLCCLEEARRYKKCGSHDSQLWHSNCKRSYVLYMTPNKNGKVIFPHWTTTIYWILPFLPPPAPHPLKFQKKFTPTNMSRLKSWFPPFTKGGGNYVLRVSFSLQIRQPVILIEMVTMPFSQCHVGFYWG